MSGDLQADALPLPASIGRYRVIARLQRDAVGDVLRGFDPMIERPVVIKVFAWRVDDLEARREIAQRFYQEMQRIGVLVHSGIVPLFDAGECADGLFMASEFVEGESLAALIERGADIDTSARVSILGQIVDAIDYAAGQGVPHLNLKPSNVLVTPDGLVKVSGFGVAAVVAAIGATPPPSPYTAPERSQGGGADGRADVFSLARLMLRLMSADGFASDAVLHTMPAVRPERWSALFARALSTDPASRFDSPRACFREWLFVCGHEDPAPRPAWDAFGPVESMPAEPDSSDTETALGLGLAHDTHTIGSGVTPHTSEPRAASSHDDDPSATITKM